MAERDLLKSFADVRMITIYFQGGVLAGGNAVMVASDRPLTDDYAPVDQLRTVK